MAALPLIYAVAGLGQLGLGAYNAWQQSQRAREAKGELDKRLSDWRNQDTSNLYANMENTYEDLTVNQQQAQFTAQQQAQGFADTMGNLRGAAGGSGIAALAQSLAGQQSLAAQQASVSIGAQEQRNQQLAAGQASRLQMMDRQGEEASRALRSRMSETELAMAMQEQAAANQARNQAISSAVGGAVNLGIGLSTGAVGDFKKQFGIGQGGATNAAGGTGPLANLTQGTSDPVTQVVDSDPYAQILSGTGYSPNWNMSASTTTTAGNASSAAAGNANLGLEYMLYPDDTGNLPVMYSNPFKND